MEFNNTNYDLGVITKGSKHEVKFPFTGNKDEIVSVRPACSCTADCLVEDDCIVAVYTEDSKLGGNYKDQYPSGYYPFQKNITVYLKDNEDLQIQTAAGIVYNPNKKYQTLTFTGKVQL